ncbi:MAG: hypothetical protein KJ935_00890 [Candidatus Omnitrophica bacterium]|nr:hypothetical protein [Candidatus Omnitrophota bacterium]
MCKQGGSRKDLENYLKDLLLKVPRGYRFVLGMSDNTPPDADFERVKMVAEMVEEISGLCPPKSASADEGGEGGIWRFRLHCASTRPPAGIAP